MGQMAASAREDAGAGLGDRLYALVTRLYPICRSITGAGVRETLRILKEHIPLDIVETPTGAAVFDWEIPKEWNIKGGYLKDGAGRTIVDFATLNLHVLNYSVPIRAKMSLAELRPHLYTLPDQPDVVPYRTSYYSEKWGFCLPHAQMEALEEGEYEAVIDSDLSPGSLSYGELFIPGESEDEILISTHVCHPSLCNDNLSGIAVATFLANAIGRGRRRRYSYRFLFIPGTIGSITWLARNEDRAHRIKHGLVLTGLGDGGPFTYKRSRQGAAAIDRAAALALGDSETAHKIIDFFPFGYDERQFCSPGFNLAVGCLMRSQHGQYPQYHTSNDNLAFVKPNSLAESLAMLEAILDVIEADRIYVSTNQKGEPRLGKRGLYRTVAGQAEVQLDELDLLWVLNLADGSHSLIDIAERSGRPFAKIAAAAAALARTDLLREAERPATGGLRIGE